MSVDRKAKNAINDRTKNTLRGRTPKAVLLALLLIWSGTVVSTLRSGQFAAPLIVLAIGITWISIIHFVRNASARHEYHSQLVLEKIRASDRTETITQERLARIAELAELNHLRGRRIEPIIRDTAGTAGKAAPRIRDIQNKLSIVRSAELATATTTQTIEQAKPQSVQKAPAFPSVSINYDGVPHNSQITALVIADEFTVSALSAEWDQVLPTPDNWREVLESRPFDLLFVESAWDGNGGAWRYHLTGQTAPRPAFKEFVAAVRARGIPTVFWNKEDPPHYKDFLETAKLFDRVYTTESAKIPSYVDDLGHNRVSVLAFAAAPHMHNPARLKGIDRDLPSVFGGTYFRHKYPERREQMDYLLPAAAKYGLDVYSRQYGKDLNYQFPDSVNQHVRGPLSYGQMLGAYHAYKVVLNVNSVPQSETMCSRRIFEATACGAAVVSPYTAAIDNFFKNGEISTVVGPDDSSPHVRALIRSDQHRQRKVHLAQREIWENHTYLHRVNTVLDDLHLPRVTTLKSVSVIVTTIRPEQLENIFLNVSQQSYGDIELVLLTHGFAISNSKLLELRTQYPISSVRYLSADSSYTLGRNLNTLIDAASGDFIVRMDDDDWYGPNYVRDLVNAARFSGADLVGKAATYIYFEGMNSTVLTYESHEHKFGEFVRGATFAGMRDVFVENPFEELHRSEDSTFLKSLLHAGGKIYSADRFNFIVRRASDKKNHTWTIDDIDLFSTGKMEFVGDGREHVEL